MTSASSTSAVVIKSSASRTTKQSRPTPRHDRGQELGYVYVDFDGTIAAGEPTDALFDRFAHPSWREIEEEWQQGRLSSRICMSQQVDLMRAEPAAIDEFLRNIEIDPDFPKFVQLCRAYGGRIVVVSDGLDRVVRTVMRASGWDLPFSANRLKWVGGDRWKLEFPHARKDCRSAMGNCKCSHGRRFPSSPAILVGDGRSDFCLAEHVHLVLAKGKLAGHCKENGLPYVQIHNFANATQVLHAWLDALGTTPAALACAAPSIIAGFEEGSP